MLGQLAPVPATFLKQLATDAELFDELPRSVQRQVGHLHQWKAPGPWPSACRRRCHHEVLLALLDAQSATYPTPCADFIIWVILL